MAAGSRCYFRICNGVGSCNRYCSSHSHSGESLGLEKKNVFKTCCCKSHWQTQANSTTSLPLPAWILMFLGLGATAGPIFLMGGKSKLLLMAASVAVVASFSERYRGRGSKLSRLLQSHLLTPSTRGGRLLYFVDWYFEANFQRI